MNLAKITIAGHIGKNAEAKTTGDGKNIVSFTVAVSVGYGDKKVTNWFDIVTFRAVPDWKMQLLNKGANVVVVGDFKETITEKDGKNYHHLNVLAETIEVFNKKEESEAPVNDNDEVPF